jgi:dihydroorotate dehydrogenase
MTWLYRTFVRPALFTQDSETIHDRAMRLLARTARSRAACRLLHDCFAPPELPVELFGLKFPNPLGLAAGMDKAAAAVPVWESLGFGFSELGGVTWHPQEGNPRPRIFRAIRDEALVNRMGFNNAGAKAFADRLVAWRLAHRWPAHPVGVNLGKSKITPIEQAAGDYEQSFTALWDCADFFVVNVSSPNTPNLRQLQDKAALDEILARLQEVNARRSAETQRPAKPVLVKVAPDLSFEALDEILALAGPRNIAGIVATNTTIQRPQTSDPVLARIYAEQGGLSGRPLRCRSTEIIRHLYQSANGQIPIIGVGGIFSAADAWEKIIAGASLLQIYTAFIYEGPGVVKLIVRGLETLVRQHGFQTLQQAVGTAAAKGR